MIRFLIIPIIISLGILILWGMWQVWFPSLRSSNQGKKDIDQIKGSDMVLDPVCQTYLPKERAIHESLGKEDYYFCSQECLKQFREKQKK